ncbi:MAG: hypothetical protein ACT4O1_06455 [Gemmatimonadota bacterium]
MAAPRSTASTVARKPLDVRRHIAVVLQQAAVETMLTVQDNLLIYATLHGVSRAEARRRMRAIVDSRTSVPCSMLAVYEMATPITVPSARRSTLRLHARIGQHGTWNRGPGVRESTARPFWH